ncbi:beta-amyrin 28-monooxygenase isoform X2 [Cajanus cajan]|uniref:beta-amyrin 28-monooxygenase isoform X1 n=1 Tax=Cajanus cajan TaxID=3821 RepID=UPI00098DCAF5|nr:beta-amyrin 28-monooxygenase isoform X1 [Cajanus cajan]XP_029127453.1 beta-amyrin 28-monooxygenase isoform X2 [Cajanus cajan]
MEVTNLVVLPAVLAFCLLCLHFINKIRLRKHPNPHLPPGRFGWPIVGETFEFMRSCLEGNSSRFIQERMEKYDSRVFKTLLFGNPMAVFCGPAGNKFLFSNENKNVQVWWPSSVKKLLRLSLVNKVGDEAKVVRKLLMSFLNAETLRNYLPKMDTIAQRHIDTYWKGKEQVFVYRIVNLYTFELACCLFLSMEDSDHLSKLSLKFDEFLKGMIGFPLNIPGTKFHRSMKAADAIRKEIKMILKKRKVDLEEKRASPTQDLLSHMLVTSDTNGRFMTEMEIIDNILLLLFAGHDTSRSVLSLVMKYLGQLPQVYEHVLKEQLEISEGKEAGKLLQWEDVQKMKYSWNVVSEGMRLSPPVSGAYREAIKDFPYADYNIPKGWKLHWSTSSSHKDPTLFLNPETFDASRFEGEGPTPFSYVPFGGGPRMCLGQEFARLEILLFMHHIVKRFKWDLVIPGEKFKYDPLLEPEKGLAIRLHPSH